MLTDTTTSDARSKAKQAAAKLAAELSGGRARLIAAEMATLTLVFSLDDDTRKRFRENMQDIRRMVQEKTDIDGPTREALDDALAKLTGPPSETDG